MKRKKSLKFHVLRHYLLVERSLPKKELRILDYGCGEGEFIGNLKGRSLDKYGIEVDPIRLSVAKKKYKDVKFRHFLVGNKLPYKNNFFDAVTLFHVLEHVDSEKRTISEIKRVLKPGGKLYVASPYDGLFAFADTANLRFRFPKLHKLAMDLILGKEEYSRRFTENSKHMLYGDCSNNRSWHKHYTEKEIETLLKSNFKIKKFYKFSLLHPFLLVLYNISDYVFGRHLFFTKYLVYLDNQLNMGNLSYNFLVEAQRK